MFQKNEDGQMCGVSAQSQPASAKLQNVFKELTLWSRKV